ncbi:MAG: hypothetical protein WCD69_26495, partial [Xanthobacteraceae bacterium]
RILSTAPDRFDVERTNPVTGGRWMNGVDPTNEQIRAAARALKARDEFAKMAPSGAPPLPLSYAAREALKIGGLPHIVAWFARSLAAQGYDFGKHPYFEPYARGVMASPYAPDFTTQDPALQQQFPPLPLKGLGPGLYWDPTPAKIRRASRFERRLFLSSAPPYQSSGSSRVVDRQDANIPAWYAPKSKALLQLDDGFVAHATKLGPCKRLPPGWQVHKPAEVFTRRIGPYQFWLVNSDHGWLVEREAWGEEDEVLANLVWHFPVLCDTYVMAARLAEAAYRGLPHQYQLMWISI